MENIKNPLHILISTPEQYEKIEIRSLTYDEGESVQGAYNGNVIVGYNKDVKDIFYLSVNTIKEEHLGLVCDKIEELFGQDERLVNLMIYNGDSIIYNLNSSEDT